MHKLKFLVYIALSFMFVDALLFLTYWLVGHGYISLAPEMHSVFMSRMGIVWDTLHVPVNETLGWLLFPNFETHYWSWSYIVYVALCLLQMFLVGIIMAIAYKEIPKFTGAQR